MSHTLLPAFVEETFDTVAFSFLALTVAFPFLGITADAFRLFFAAATLLESVVVFLFDVAENTNVQILSEQNKTATKK